MPPAYVKPYVKRNKNDGRDAEAICEAVGRPTMRFVPVKSVEQQATLAVHGTRALLVRQRTMVGNSLRAALSELGIVAAQGLKGLHELMAKLETANEEIPEMLRGALLVLARHWQALDIGERARSSGRSRRPPRADHEARRLMAVPGVGPDHRQHGFWPKCRMRRCSAAGGILRPGSGLTGRDHGHRRQASSRAHLQQGDRMLRALLISGASAHLRATEKTRH